MRWLLPWRHFAIETTLAPEEVEATLLEHLGADKGWNGTVGEGTFSIGRRIGYKNSFLPLVTGRIEPLHPDRAAGARVHVRMSMHVAVRIFMAVWIGFASLLASAFVVIALKAPGPLDLAQLAPLGFPLLGLALMLGGFAPEARRAETFLRSIFPPAQLGSSVYR